MQQKQTKRIVSSVNFNISQFTTTKVKVSEHVKRN